MSFGAEVELHNRGLKLLLTHLKIALTNDRGTHLIKIDINPKIQIGPTKLIEKRGFVQLAELIIRTASENHCTPSPKLLSIIRMVKDGKAEPGYSQANLKEYEEYFTGRSIELIPETPANFQCPPPDGYQEPVDINTFIFRDENVVFSVDHGNGIAIPELITKPIGFNQNNPSARIQIFNYLCYFFHFATYLLKNDVQNIKCKVVCFLLEDLFETFDARISIRGLKCLLSVGKADPQVQEFMGVQFTTSVDLTQWTWHRLAPTLPVEAGGFIPPSPDPLIDLFHLALPMRCADGVSTTDIEIAIVILSRHIIEKAVLLANITDTQASNRNAWLAGAMGMGIWFILSLCSGGRPPIFPNGALTLFKNLFVIMPKTNMKALLMGAALANLQYVSLITRRIIEACNYGINNLDNYAAEIQVACKGKDPVPILNTLRDYLRNRIRIKQRLSAADPLSTETENIKRILGCIQKDELIVSTLIYAFFASVCPGIDDMIFGESTIGRENFTNVVSTIAALSENFARGIIPGIGTGRAMLEIRQMQRVNTVPRAETVNHLIDIFMNVAKPTIAPPAVKKRTSTGWKSIDSPDNASTEFSFPVEGVPEFDKTHLSRYFWFPGYSEQGGRKQHVSDWLEHQAAVGGFVDTPDSGSVSKSAESPPSGASAASRDEIATITMKCAKCNREIPRHELTLVKGPGHGAFGPKRFLCKKCSYQIK